MKDVGRKGSEKAGKIITDLRNENENRRGVGR